MGDFYLNGGIYVAKDEKKGIDLLEKAIDKNYLLAFYSLANYYQENDEDRKAFKIYKKGKELNDKECIIQLALCYLKGKGTAKDEEKGINLLEDLIDKDSCDAIDALSNYYYEAKKYDDYFSLLKRGTELGRAKYFIKLGKCYQEGIGTGKDEVEAFNLIEKAAIKFDDGEAYYELGTFYDKGIGVKKNPEMAEVYYKKAKDNGYELEPEPKKRLKDYYQGDSENENSYKDAIIYNTDNRSIIESCIVYIESERGSGSGFIIDSNGYIATCAHVVKNTEELYIRFTAENQKEKKIIYKGTVIKLNEKTDTAIIKIESRRTFPFIALDDREEAEVGEDIVLYGYPLGNNLNDDVLNLNISFDKGSVSSNQIKDNIKITTLSIAAKHGHSGSPIISRENGKVIGILKGGLNPDYENNPTDEINYMVPICYLKDLIKESQLNVNHLKNLDEIKAFLKSINEQISLVVEKIEGKHIGAE